MNIIFLKKSIKESKAKNKIATLNFFLEKENKFYTIDRKETLKSLVDIVIPIKERETIGVPDFVFDKITGIFDYENIKNFDLDTAKTSIFSVIFPESLI